MIELLLIVIVCGIAAWVAYSAPMPQPFLNIFIGLLLIIIVLAVFSVFFGVGLPLHSIR